MIAYQSLGCIISRFLCVKKNTGHFSIAEFAFGKIISNEKYYFNIYSSFSISRRSIKKLL